MADRNTDTVMKKTLAPVAALLIGISILLTGQGLQGTLLPIRASLEEFATISIGIMGAMYFLGFTAGCLRGGELVRRVGHIRVFAAMTALASSIPLLHGLFLNPWIWGLFRMITGFCFAVLYVVIESWLNEQSSNETRGTIFSIYLTCLELLVIHAVCAWCLSSAVITTVLMLLVAIPITGKES